MNTLLRCNKTDKILHCELLRNFAKFCEKSKNSVIFKMVPKYRFSSNYKSRFMGLYGTDVEKCKKIYCMCF